MFVASKYQTQIFKDILSEDIFNIVVTAVPGSGKSETIKQTIPLIDSSKSILVCAFNSDAAKSLEKKVATFTNVDASTIHSVGKQALTASKMCGQLNNFKYNNIISDELLDSGICINPKNGKPDKEVVKQVKKLVDLMRLTLVDEYDQKAIMKIINRFDIDIDTKLLNEIYYLLPDILDAGKKSVKSVIDFTDMIYLPIILGLTIKKYDYVFVDECQDLSPAARKLVLSSRKSGGKFAAFGQREQAINGFAGASLRSIDEIKEETGAIERPLSICYRCPKCVVDLAGSMYPGIEASSTARDGRIEYILDEEVQGLVEAGDMILSRVNAPLVTMCLSLLRDGKRANVRGNNIGDTFLSLLNKIEKFNKSFRYEDLTQHTMQYQKFQLEDLMLHEEENEAKIQRLNDGIQTLLVLHSAYEDYFTLDLMGHEYTGLSKYLTNQTSPSLDGFKAVIKAFFTEDKDALIILSTGHKAKGQEKRRIFFLGYDKSFKTRTEEDKVQAKNLDYVMVTRVLDDKEDPGSGVLFLVGEWDKNPVNFFDPNYTGRFALVQEEIKEVEEEEDEAYNNAESICMECHTIATNRIVDSGDSELAPCGHRKTGYFDIVAEKNIAPVQAEISAPLPVLEIAPPAKKRGRKAKQEEEKATYKQYSMSRDMIANIAAMSDMIDYSGKEGGIPESRMLAMIIEASPLYQEYLKTKEVMQESRELVEAL